jgi:hypothetical protein
MSTPVAENVQGGQTPETPVAVPVEGGATEIIVAEPVQGGAVEGGYGTKKGAAKAKRTKSMKKSKSKRKYVVRSPRARISYRRTPRGRHYSKTPGGSRRGMCPENKVVHRSYRGKMTCVSKHSPVLPKSQRACRHGKVRKGKHMRCIKGGAAEEVVQQTTVA